MTRWFNAVDAPKYWMNDLTNRMIDFVQERGGRQASMDDGSVVGLDRMKFDQNGVLIDPEGSVDIRHGDLHASVAREHRGIWARFSVGASSRRNMADWARAVKLPDEMVDMIANGVKGVSGPLEIISDSGWFRNIGPRRNIQTMSLGGDLFYACADIFHRDPERYYALINDQGVEVIYPDVYDLNEVGIFLEDEAYERCCARGIRTGDKTVIFAKMWRDIPGGGRHGNDEERIVIAATDEAAFIFSKLLLK